MKYIKEYLDFNNIDNFENDYEDFDGHEKFKEFLEKNGVLDKFVRNFYNFEDDEWKREYWGGYDSHSDEYTLNDFLINNKEMRYGLYIDDAFDWDNSPEGYDFWDDVNDAWKFYMG
jgi:hypothetical protein